MRIARVLAVALAATALSLPVLAGIAGAGASVLPGTLTCVTSAESGGFILTITITNPIPQPGEITGGFDSIGAGGEGPGGPLEFDPSTLPASGTSSAVFPVPAGTLQVGGQVVVTYPSAPTASYLIDGKGVIAEICGTPVTTPTTDPTTTTDAATPATAAPATVATAAGAQPRFTG